MDWTLQSRPGAQPPAGPVIVVVMDGVGVGRGDEGDAVALARTPTLDGLRTRFPWRTLRAHGTAVGLPDDGDMGNSEVGHNALGAGRIFDQGAKLVNPGPQGPRPLTKKKGRGGVGGFCGCPRGMHKTEMQEPYRGLVLMCSACNSR